MVSGANTTPYPSSIGTEGKMPQMMQKTIPQVMQAAGLMASGMEKISLEEASQVTHPTEDSLPNIVSGSIKGSGTCTTSPSEIKKVVSSSGSPESKQSNISPQIENDTNLSSHIFKPGVSSSDKLTVPKRSPPLERLEIVVAHYKEDLKWLDPFLSHPNVKVLIYSKGGKTLPPKLHAYTIYLDNIGREGHTYLYHIVTRYDSFRHVTLFCQGDPFDHFKVDYTPEEFLEDALKTTDQDFATFRGQTMEMFCAWDGINFGDYPLLRKWNDMKMKPAGHTPAQYWKLFMGPLGYKVPESIGFAPGANFAVTAVRIKQHPRSFWVQVLNELFLGPMEDINPMTGHICERFWPAFMDPTEFIMYPGDTPSDIIYDPLFSRLTKGNWKILPKDPTDFVPSATPHDLAMVLGVDTLDKEMASEMHKKGSIDMSGGKTSNEDL